MVRTQPRGCSTVAQRANRRVIASVGQRLLQTIAAPTTAVKAVQPSDCVVP
ncbi:hypothetical protein [Streptomyces lydicus]|uniref:hypothetical protein n=1 Tax=Streptomyces lydicus TaxID=47763 RepID=UPI0037BCB3F3